MGLRPRDRRLNLVAMARRFLRSHPKYATVFAAAAIMYEADLIDFAWRVALACARLVDGEPLTVPRGYKEHERGRRDAAAQIRAAVRRRGKR